MNKAKHDEIINKLTNEYDGDFDELTEEEQKIVVDTELSIYEPRLRKVMEKGMTKEDACGWICGLFHEYEIQEPTEEALYYIADPNDEVEDAPFEIWYELIGDNPLMVG